MYNSKIYEDEMKRWVKGAESEESELRKAGRLPALKGKFELTEILYDHFCVETFKMPAYAHLFNVFNIFTLCIFIICYCGLSVH